jgi:16S rRNA (uracil1498-N3)-methyltransferase
VVVIPDPLGPEPGEMAGGVAYLATITQVTDEVRVMPVAPLEGTRAGASFTTDVGIVQALTRPAAMDYLVEKGTEVGASFFLILPVTGSPSRAEKKQGARLARWRRIAQEAAKQSKQLRIPSVEVADSVQEGLVRLGAESRSLVLEPGAADELYGILSSVSGRRVPARGAWAAQRPPRLALWVGTESGWTEDELAVLGIAGARTVRLGQSVLRAETAGPVAVAVARLALGDW